MYKYKSSIYVLTILFIFSLTLLFVVEAGIKENLESVYKNFIDASKKKDEEAIKQKMSSYSYATTKNQVISGKREFNVEIFKRMSEFMPNIDELQYIKTIHNGNTAALVYGKNLDSATERETTVIKFVNEEGSWKYDLMSSHQGEKDFSDRAIIDEYGINGVVKETPSVYPEPEYAGIINATSYGYRMVVFVNGIKQVDLQNKSIGGLIMGGLKNGENKIDIKLTKIDKDTMFTPEISILKIPGPGKSGEEIYKFEPKGEVKNNYTEIIIIKNQI